MNNRTGVAINRRHPDVTVRKFQRLIEEQGVERIVGMLADALDAAHNRAIPSAGRYAKAIRAIPRP